MQSHLFRLAVLASLVSAGVLAVVIASGVSGTLVMTINTLPSEMYAGGNVTGTASDAGADIVQVKMYIDGVLVAQDHDMEGGDNQFDFPIPADAVGKELKIVATNNKGDTVVRKYTVR